VDRQYWATSPRLRAVCQICQTSSGTPSLMSFSTAISRRPRSASGVEGPAQARAAAERPVRPSGSSLRHTPSQLRAVVHLASIDAWVAFTVDSRRSTTPTRRTVAAAGQRRAVRPSRSSSWSSLGSASPGSLAVPLTRPASGVFRWDGQAGGQPNGSADEARGDCPGRLADEPHPRRAALSCIARFIGRVPGTRTLSRGVMLS